MATNTIPASQLPKFKYLKPESYLLVSTPEGEGLVTKADFLRTITIPAAQITGTSGNFEVGQTVSISVAGSYVKNDGGDKTADRILKNGIKAADGASFSTSIKMSASPVSFHYEADYAAAPSGQVAAGTAKSSAITFKGQFRVFAGMVDALPTDGASIRTVLLATSGWDTGTSFNINTNGSSKTILIALPNGKTVTGAKNQNTNEALTFTKTSITTVPDAAGDMQNYNVYSFTSSVPYSAGQTINITTT